MVIFFRVSISYSLLELFLRPVNEFRLSKETEYFQQLDKAHLKAYDIFKTSKIITMNYKIFVKAQMNFPLNIQMLKTYQMMLLEVCQVSLIFPG